MLYKGIVEMKKHVYYIVNGFALYRLIAAPILLYLVISNEMYIFKWLLLISFLTGAIDSFLAHKFKVASIVGAKLESFAGELTVLAALIGVFLNRPDFVLAQNTIIIAVLVLYLLQTALAFKRYGKISSFHTYLAKAAAVLQVLFLVLIFFWEPVAMFFYVVVLLTAIELLEKVVLVFLLPHWRANVKGLYWVLKEKTRRVY